MRVLIKRNLMVYIRDKGAVFFSLLSMLIIILLMGGVLGNMNVDTIMEILESFGVKKTVEITGKAEHLVLLWTIAGILVVNTFTVSTTMMGIMIQDEQRGKLAEFFVSPVSRIRIMMGYVTGAFLVSSGISLITFLLAQGYVLVDGGKLLSLQGMMFTVGCIILNAFVAAGLLFFAALFVRSESSWVGFTTIIGTLSGFVGAIYLPMGLLPDGVQNVLKCLPLLHGTALMRRIFTEDAVSEVFAGLPVTVGEGYSKSMGISVTWGGEVISSIWHVIILLGFGIILLSISAFLMKRRSGRDR